MLLQRLADYAHQHITLPPFHREREFHWRLNIPSDGTPARLLNIVSPDGNGTPRGERRLVPAVTRTVGVAPQLGADDVQYVLGWGDDTTKPKRVQQCHNQFVALLTQWAEQAAPDEPAAAVVRNFYADNGVASLEVPEKYTAKQGVLITVDDIPIVQHDSLARFWTSEILRRKGTGREGICLVCGQHRPLMDTIPGSVAQRLVPGAGNEAALVSVNEQAYGYGLTIGLGHTPICATCSDAVNSALTQLLDSEHVLTLPGQDSALTWWSLGDGDADFRSALASSPDADAVNRLLSRLRSGQLDQASQQVEQFSADRFCSVSLGGNASRIMIRDWVDQPLATTVGNLARWYDDLLMVSPWDTDAVATGLWNLVLATGRWDRQQRRYPHLSATVGGRPNHVQRDLLSSCLHAHRLPPAVLHHVLHRIATDSHLDTARAALLRLALRRHPTKEVAMSAGLDETCEDTAYVSGRVFAHLEQIQYAASDGKPNVTFADRFLSGAITNPTPALNAGEKLAPAWLSKLRRRPDTAGTAHVLDRKLSDLRALLDRGQPATGYLPPDQQALFLLGYHHQKSHDAAQARQHKHATQHDE